MTTPFGGQSAAGILAGFLGGLALGCGVGGSVPSPGPPVVLDLDILLDNTRGGTLRLADYDGKVRILNFWATWCEPCTKEIPHFNQLVRKFEKRGFQMIGISLDMDAETVQAFERELPLEYPSGFINDELADSVPVIPMLPTSLVISRDGTVHKQHFGLTAPELFEEDLEYLLSLPEEEEDG